MIFAVVAVLAALSLLLGPVTSLMGGAAVRHLSGKDKADAINAVRQTLLQAAAGTAALTVLIFTGLTFNLNRRGQVTDRYTKAIGLLASGKLDERIGGIYALEHVMMESKRDHETVVQVLAAFVREHASVEEAAGPSLWIDPPPRRQGARPHRRRTPTADIQAALTVLSRRPSRQERQDIDLSGTDLRGANLEGANLAHAYLGGVHLQEAYLAKADLEAAMFPDAHLEGVALTEANLKLAHLGGVHLDGAVLGEARLDGAHLQWAHLGGARMRKSHLEGARMEGVDLRGADLDGAYLRNADLEGADLRGSDLGGADLQDTNLGAAYLEGVFLSEANLRGAVLEEANLVNTDLSETVGLTRRQLRTAMLDDTTRLPKHLRIEQGDGTVAETP